MKPEQDQALKAHLPAIAQIFTIVPRVQKEIGLLWHVFQNDQGLE
jgi:hypothetical protein